MGRLTNGKDAGVEATDCMEFIDKADLPQNCRVTYANFVCDYQPLKTEPFRIRLVVGGDRLDFADDTGAPAASMLETKLLVNSVISEAAEGARFMSCDLKDFFSHKNEKTRIHENCLQIHTRRHTHTIQSTSKMP